MKTRIIRYADPEEDWLQSEVDTALNMSMDQRLKTYCNTISALYAMAGIDTATYKVKRKIGYSDE